MAIQQEGSGSFQHLLQCGFQLFFCKDFDTGDFVPFRNCHKIGISSLRVAIHQLSISTDTSIETVFPLSHHSKMLVVQNNHLHTDIFRAECSQFLNIHLERTVAVDIDDCLFRECNFCTHCSGQTKAHGTKSAGSQELARELQRIELCRPHLMLSDTGNDDCIAIGEFTKLFNHKLRFQLSITLVAERMSSFPLGNLSVPCSIILADGIFIQRFQNFLDISNHAQIDMDVFVDFRKVDINMNFLCIFGKCSSRTGHAVIKSCTEANQQIAFICRIVCVISSMHSQPAERKRMIFRN